MDFNHNESPNVFVLEKLPTLNDTIPQSFQNSPMESNTDLLCSAPQDPLTINESAILSSTEHYEIGDGSIEDYRSKNTSYFLDSIHGWQSNKYDAIIESVEDQRQWIKNPDFGLDLNMNATRRIVNTYNSAHPYSNNQNYVTLFTLDGNGCNYMRVHFVNITMQSGVDYILFYDQSGKKVDEFTDSFLDVLTPWYNASKIVVKLYSDSSVRFWGCQIDYFEMNNNTMPNLVNTSNWTYYSKYLPGETLPSRFCGNWTQPHNQTGVWAQIGGIEDSGYYTYYAGDESGFTQNLTVPRGELIDAWISLDYLVWHGLATNDLFLFVKLNDQLIYSKGFRTVSDNNNLCKWTSSGLINLQLWENSSSLFSNYLKNENIRICFGIKSSASCSYNGFADEEIQCVYFDNIELILKTRANVTQSDIDLRVNNHALNISTEYWGIGYCLLEGLWTLNPVQLTFTTISPHLEFNIRSNLFAFHISNSSIAPNLNEGVQLSVHSDGQIFWDWYHNVYTPPTYTNFSFEVFKPRQWSIQNVQDPTGLNTSFDGGNYGQESVCINQSFAYYPGWWHFKASSPNLLSTDYTVLWTNSQWTNISNYNSNNSNFDVFDQFCLNSVIQENLLLIPNLASTWMNLSIYLPNNTLWWKEEVHPSLMGEGSFSNVTFGAINTTAGMWHFTLLWNNGTSVGGIFGTFELHHLLEYRLLYPKDVSSDLIVERFLGDLISVRLMLNDYFTGALISGVQVGVNLTSTPTYLTEVSSGIYDGSYDTSEASNPGIYFINFTAICIGFYDLSFVMQFNIIQETDFQVLSIDSDIHLGNSFSIIVTYNIKGSGIGLDDVTLSLNLSSSYLIIPLEIVGRYQLQINSSDFTHAGLHILQINISKPNYQSQFLRERITIEPKLVNFTIYANNQDCTLNKSINTWINSLMNLNVKVNDVSECLLINHGSLQLIDQYANFHCFFIQDNQFHLQMNSSEFGMGLHYMTLIYNETDYAISTIPLQLNILQKPVFYSLQCNSTIISTPGHQFEIQIDLFDQDTLSPILGAQITYSWIFGVGYLTEIGNGLYFLNSSSPYQIGTYEIQITINAGESYRIQSLQIHLINQKDPGSFNSTLWWVILIVSFITLALLFALIKFNVVNPKRLQKMIALEKRTQVFEDIQNIQDVMVIQKSSGLLLYNYNYDIKKEEQDVMVTGFLQAIMLFSSNVMDKEISHSHGDGLEFHHNHFNIYVVDGLNVRVAVILSKPASSQIKIQAHNFLKQFEQTFAAIVGDWDGNTELFTHTSIPLIEEIFQLILMKNYAFAGASYVYEYLHTKVKPNSMTDRVFKIIETLVKDRKIFRITTVISLLPEIERIYAKESILELIQHKVIVPVRGNFEKHLVVEEKKVTRLILYPVTNTLETKKI